MADVFMSYARKDRERLRPLVEILAALGWTVWWDVQIASGKEFEVEIAAELKAARCVVVAWSQASVGSRWVRGEGRDGLERGIAVPVLLDPVQPPIDFRAVHYTDLTAWRGAPTSPEIAELISAISTILRSPPVPHGHLTLALEAAARQRKLIVQVGGAIIAGLLCLIGLIEHRALVWGYRSIDAAAYALTNDEPLRSDFVSTVETQSRFIESRIPGQLAVNLDAQRPDSWGGSQLILASAPTRTLDAEALRFVNNTFRSDCKCWNTFDDGKQVVAAAWVLLVYARAGHEIPREQLNTILSLQSQDGWWPSFSDARRQELYASSYATALVIFALHQYRMRLVPDTSVDAAKIDAAIAQGGNWLFNYRPKPGELWSDYPNDATGGGLKSRSVSAMIAFIFLDVFDDERADVVFREWFRGLSQATSFDSYESSVDYIQVESGVWRRDGTRYPIFSWELAALCRGYDRLGLSERISAQLFLLGAEDSWEGDAHSGTPNFISSEALIAVAYGMRAAKLKSGLLRILPPNQRM